MPYLHFYFNHTFASHRTALAIIASLHAPMAFGCVVGRQTHRDAGGLRTFPPLHGSDICLRWSLQPVVREKICLGETQSILPCDTMAAGVE